MHSCNSTYYELIDCRNNDVIIFNDVIKFLGKIIKKMMFLSFLIWERLKGKFKEL